MNGSSDFQTRPVVSDRMQAGHDSTATDHAPATAREFQAIVQRLAPLRARLAEHPLYRRLTDLGDVHRFMESHIFAVWDFMSLLKGLQRELTSVEVPWVPRGDGTARRLINEIVLGEESDESPDGRGFLSHFELYRAAMVECGADTRGIDGFLAALGQGLDVQTALDAAQVPAAAADFVRSSFECLEAECLPGLAAAFTLGREDIIPAMFSRLVEDLSARHSGRLSLLIEYLRRHIELDGERHGPMARRLLEGVCGQDSSRWERAQAGAQRALEARLAFWDGISAAL